MLEAAAILERIDQCIRELEGDPGRGGGVMPTTSGNGLDAELRDTIALWCRQGCGVKRGKTEFRSRSRPATRTRDAHKPSAGLATCAISINEFKGRIARS